MANTNDVIAGQYTTSNTTGTTSATITCVPVPAISQGNVIDWIGVYMVGTVSAYDVNVTTNGGTSIARFGGQLGGAAVPPVPMYFPGLNIRCTSNDQTKIVLTCTGASACAISAGYHHEPF